MNVPALVPGDYKQAGLRVVELIHEGPRTGSTTYKIIYLCCGREGVATHHNINKRWRLRTSRCPKCTHESFKKSAEQYREQTAQDCELVPLKVALQDYGIDQRHWPVPPMVPRGNGWVGRR